MPIIPAMGKGISCAKSVWRRKRLNLSKDENIHIVRAAQRVCAFGNEVFENEQWPQAAYLLAISC